MPADLGGLSILVTRAVHQAGPLCELIQVHSGEAVRFPVTVIEAPADPVVLERAIVRVCFADIVIFVSPNAVKYGFNALHRYQVDIPPDAEVLAVGPGTANRLAARGRSTPGVPEQQFNSEGLLQLPQLQSVRGKKVLIFRGEGGRELLRDRLVTAGAVVDYVECYRRTRPAKIDNKVLTKWRQARVDIVTLTSITAVDNLFHILGCERSLLLDEVTIATVSGRIERHCREQDCRGTILVSDQATDESLVEAMMDWHRQSGLQSGGWADTREQG